MGDIKDKLLAALQSVDLAELDEARLVDIIVGRIQVLEKECDRLRGENAHERQMLHSDREALNEDRHKLRRDPRYGAQGIFSWGVPLKGHESSRIIVEMAGGVFRQVYIREGGVDFICQPIERAMIAARTKEPQDG